MPGGLEHKLSTLTCAIHEAVCLDRILVLRKFALPPNQNFIHSQKSKGRLVDAIVSNTRATDSFKPINIDFENYINLAKTKIYRLEHDGTLLQIKKPLRYIAEQDFALNAYTDNVKSITTLDNFMDLYPTAGFTAVNDHILIAANNAAISAQQNNKYQVVLRRTNAFRYISTSHAQLAVILYPADEVERLTDIVLTAMGSSLKRVKNRYAFYNGKTTTEIQSNYRMEFSQKHPLYYACIHVRANDAFYYSRIRYGTDQRNLEHVVSQTVPRKSIIYIMSDINDPHYFDFLRKDYTLYQYFDFPELSALVANEDQQKIDNAMLYAVEKNILQYAHIRITRTRNDSKIFYINNSYRTPWRYRFISLYDYVTTDTLKRNISWYSGIPLLRVVKDALKRNPYNQ